MNGVFEKTARFEHRFWLQILGDHSRFIFEALSPLERETIEKASAFIQVFDDLLEKAKTENIINLTTNAEAEVVKLRNEIEELEISAQALGRSRL